MRTTKMNVTTIDSGEELEVRCGSVIVNIRGSSNESIIIAERDRDTPDLTKGDLVKLLLDWPDDTQIVVTIPLESGEQITYNLLPIVGAGWRPSGVAELTLGAFATG